MGPRSQRTGRGLRLATRLYLAIGGAVAMTLVASVVAWMSFIELADQQQRIARIHLPAITESLRLAKQSAMIAAAVPELLTVSDESERLSAMHDLENLEHELLRLLDMLAATLVGHASENDDPELALEAVRQEGRAVSQSMLSLGRLVGHQLSLKAALSRRVDEAAELHRKISDRLVPLIDDNTFYLVTGYRSLADEEPVPFEDRADDRSLLGFAALGDLAAEANLMLGLLTEASRIPDVALLQPMSERFDAAAERFSIALTGLPELAGSNEIRQTSDQLIALGRDDDGIVDLRRRILQYDKAALDLVARNRALAAGLTEDVDRIVDDARQGTRESVARTSEAIDFGRGLLLSLNLLAVTGAMVIGWMYVKRSFTAPMATLTAAAEDFERGRFRSQMLEPTVRRRDELGHLARTFARMASEVQARTDTLDRLVAERTLQLNDKNVALEQSLKRIADEMDMAQRMQLSILPTRMPAFDSLALFARMRAAREVSGDFYDIIELDADRVGIVIADVSDKGVPAALLMAVCCTRIKSIAMRDAAPGRVLAELNVTLSENNDAAMFVTTFYGVVELSRGVFTYANAGHDAPLLLRRGRPVEPLPLTGGIALGIVPDAAYMEHRVELQPGDTVFFYTDGITEAFNPRGEPFSAPRLMDVLYRARSLSVENLCLSVIAEVETHAANAPQSDDITCLAIRFEAGPVTGIVPAGAQPELAFAMGPDLAELPRLAEQIERFCLADGLPSSLAFQLNLVLDELVTNTITHGERRGERLRVEIRLRREGPEIVLTVEDDASPFNPLDLPPPEMDKSLEEREIGGLGIHLVRTTMDSLEYQRDGDRNRLVMRKSL